MGSYRYRSLREDLYIPCRSLVEALYTLNSSPVVSRNTRVRDVRVGGSRVEEGSGFGTSSNRLVVGRV